MFRPLVETFRVLDDVWDVTCIWQSIMWILRFADIVSTRLIDDTAKSYSETGSTGNLWKSTLMIATYI